MLGGKRATIKPFAAFLSLGMLAAVFGVNAYFRLRKRQ
jgi:hypothetical protein